MRPGLVALFVASSAGIALAQEPGGTLRLSHWGNPPSASILEESTISTLMPYMAVFNNLVMFDPKRKQNSIDGIVPDLATEWAWSDGGATLTLKLREGVIWHDGQPFTSADVECTFDLIQERAAEKLRRNPRKAWFWNLQEVTADGPHSVTFRLGKPQPSFLALLASGHTPIYPCHVSPEAMRTHPIGTGPFKFNSFRRNQKITLVRNEQYWKEKLPYLDGIEYTIIESPASAMLAFASGQIDFTFVTSVTPPLMRDIKAKRPDASCEQVLVNAQIVMLLNREKPPFDDPKLRQAAALALDRQAFNDVLYEGTAAVGGMMMPPPSGAWGMPSEMLETVTSYGPEVAGNREKARAIMAELGYGPEKPLKLTVITRSLAVYRDPAIVLIDQLRQIFIEAELQLIETGVWFNRLTSRDYAIAVDVPNTSVDDPDVVLFEMFTCGAQRNYAGYCNPDLEKAFYAQSAMTDTAARREAMWEIERQLLEDQARPVLIHPRLGTCWQASVKDFVLQENSIYNNWRFEDVWLAR